MTDKKYEIDGGVHKVSEVESSDWFVDFMSRETGRRTHFICVQFGSFQVDEAEAKEIANKILAGLNQ